MDGRTAAGWSWIAVLAGVSLGFGCSDAAPGSMLPGAGSGAASSGSNSNGNGSGSGNGSGGFAPNGAGGNSSGAGGGDECSGMLPATIRDFQQAHPDFQTFTGSAAYTGIVETTLGSDGKPVYAHPGGTPQTTGPTEYAQWYNDTNGVNQPFPISIQLTESSPGQFTYDNSAFFPIDGLGWGDEGNGHNFHFTTELHTQFTYEGGEVFTFTGDDDLWLFINGQLAIDLGGLHPQLSQTIDLDASASQLGISIGNTYPMDIFHAERHTNESNFRIQTSIKCFTPVPPPQ